jgi:molybdopterin-guanine dinucleotide biosynthesis protein A
MIEHVLERISGLGQNETLLITNKPDLYAYLQLPTYTDLLPEKGSLGGIYTALHYSASAYTLCVACDMPFLNVKLLRHLIDLSKAGEHHVIVPRVDGYPEGMHAVYSKACLAPIRARLDTDQLKIIGFYEDVRVRYIDESQWQAFDAQGLSFLNINTPDELRAAQSRLLSDN